MPSILQSLTPLFEIAFIALMFNYLLSFFWNTRSMDLILGFLAFLLIFAGSSWLNLPILRKIMLLVANVAVIAILIIFQPELRVALSKLSLKGKRSREISEYDKFLDQLTSCIYRLAEKRVGALIVLENKHSLSDYARTGVTLNAQFSPELIETIFTTTTPLHDGAVILRDKTLLAASIILPLAEENFSSSHTSNASISTSMGTRHRAALGISGLTDAVIIVVSEESGKVSIARDGAFTRGVKSDRFKGVLRSVFAPVSDQITQPKLNLWRRLWQ